MSIKQGVAALCLSAATVFTSATAVAEEKTQEKNLIATINGQPVTQEQLFAYARITAPQANLQDPGVRKQLMQSFLGRELMYQEALKLKLDQQPAIKAALEETTHSIISQAYVAQLMKENPVNEATAREIYDKQIASRKGTEYQTRHILVPSEDEAKGAISRLKRGEDFAKVAQALSKDSSAPRGGELGWVSPEKMPTAFANALTALKPGKYTTTPVKTDFGWHVIQLEANRPITPPPYEDVRDQLMQGLREMALNQHLAELQKRAKIEFSSSKQ